MVKQNNSVATEQNNSVAVERPAVQPSAALAAAEQNDLVAVEERNNFVVWSERLAKEAPAVEPELLAVQLLAALAVEERPRKQRLCLSR